MEKNTKSSSAKVARWGSSSPTWEELLGSNNWNGLLEPELDLELRKFILRCGNFCEATYDAFINEEMILPMPSFFKDVVLQNASDYQVRSFLYAPSGIMVTRRSGNIFKMTNWIGCVAVTTDDVSRATGRREIYVVWRGTGKTQEWITDILGAINSEPIWNLVARIGDDDEPTVHKGWFEMYTQSNDENIVPGGLSVRDQLHNVIKKLRQEYKLVMEKPSLVITGHSLGGALATLSAFDLVENEVIGDRITGATAIVFSCPQVGNEAFKKRVDSHSNLKILQVKNILDLVPNLPGLVFPNFATISTSELNVSSWKSPYLETSVELQKFQGTRSLDQDIWEIIDYLKKGASNLHNLEAALHLVAWWNGMDKEFDKTPKVKRSLALVNKWSNFLKAELGIPASWWDDKNKKGMVYDESTGEWVLVKPINQ